MVGKRTEKQEAEACRVAIEVAADLINRVCGGTGARAISIGDSEARLTFSVPPDVVKEIDGNPGMTLEEATETLYRLPWAERWSAGVATMAYGKTKWDALSPTEREEIQKRLIREKLAPELVD